MCLDQGVQRLQRLGDGAKLAGPQRNQGGERLRSTPSRA
jgi:hypothetical protein